MNFIKTLLLLTYILSFTPSIITAKEIQTIFTYTTPPYVFKDGTGIVIDIVRASLKYKGHTIEPVFVNIGRGMEMFKNGHVDASSIIKKSSGIKAFYSDYFMQYHNVAITLQSSNIKIQKIEDLKNYYFTSFQNAKKYIGEEFTKATIEAAEKYSEVADQKQQVYMFLKGRTEVAVMDKNIFTFYKNMLIDEKKVDKNIKVNIFDIFPPTKYRTAFIDKKLRDDFNTGLKSLKESGEYNKIYQYYNNRFFEMQR